MILVKTHTFATCWSIPVSLESSSVDNIFACSNLWGMIPVKLKDVSWLSCHLFLKEDVVLVDRRAYMPLNLSELPLTGEDGTGCW